MKLWLKRYFPIILIVILMGVVYATGLYRDLSFKNLKAYHSDLLLYVSKHPISAPVIFIMVYIIATALSIPGGIFLSLLGGFLFPVPLSTLYVVIGATIGATLLFLSARSALGERLFQKAGPLLKKMEKGFKENAVSYLLFLRFVPLFPFWLVNLAPAFFNVKLRTFIWTTFVGILPGAYVFTQAGEGLGAIFQSQGGLSLDAIFNLKIKIALIALGIFALIPIVVKKIRGKNA
ncbi:MAG: TVP38/TMEM64 family protein [Verrucomicrobia bacterium]|nr:TVP38/TMEM64 family protein [Verrucomicrobiota bacterium]